MPASMYSLRRPPEGLSGFLLLIWPLIFVQLVALKRWVRAKYGRGVPYLCAISPWGRVYLRRIPTDCGWTYAAPGAIRPAAFAVTPFARSARLALALAPEIGAVPMPVRVQSSSSVYDPDCAAAFDTS